MAIVLYSGLPGHGKTTALARQALQSLKFSDKIYRKNQHIRPIYSNILFSDKINDRYGHLIEYFDDIQEMHTWKDCDIFIDEMSLYFDSQNWEKLQFRTKKYLRLHRHYDVNIYGAVQDFTTIDITVRRLTTRMFHLIKFIGTREPSPYLPPIRFPFNLASIGKVKKSHWELEKEHYENESSETVLFTKKDFSIFDTRQELPDIALPPLLKHYRTIKFMGGPRDGYKETKYI